MRNKTLRKRRDRALLDAVLMDDAAAVRSLLAEGADVNARDAEHGETALLLARSDGVRRLLLDHGADVTARDGWGRTAFMVTRDPLFLQAGVDINARDDEGETALMKAIDAAQFDRLGWLLANGADVNIQDEDGRSALDRVKGNLILTLSQILQARARRGVDPC